MRGLAARAHEACWASRGQSTLEYALVLLAFLGTVVALGLIWRASRDGRLVERAGEAASHELGSGITIGLLQDVLAF